MVAQSTKNPQKFNESVRERYLDLLRAGHGRFKAARAVGVHSETVRRFSRASEEFRDAVDEAEAAACEPVEARLYEAAQEGEPWAVKMWLERRSKARWGAETKVSVEHSGVVGVAVGAVTGEALDRIAALRGSLEERREVLAAESGDVLDVESRPALTAGGEGA